MPRIIKHEFDFTAAPPVIGHVHRKGFYRYELARLEPMRRVDGTRYTRLWWLALCPRCGDLYEQPSGLRCTNLNRHCKDCVDPKRRAAGKLGAWAAQRKKDAAAS